MNIVETELMMAENSECGYVCYKCTYQYGKWKSYSTKRDFLNHIKRPMHLNNKDPTVPSITTMYKKYNKYPLQDLQYYMRTDQKVIRYFYHTIKRTLNKKYYVESKTYYLGDKDEKDYDIEQIKRVFDIYEMTEDENYKYHIIRRLEEITKEKVKQSNLWCQDVAGIIAEYI